MESEIGFALLYMIFFVYDIFLNFDRNKRQYVQHITPINLYF